MQLNSEAKETFTLPTLQIIFDTVSKAKNDAKFLCDECGINLDSYDDDFLLKNTEDTIKIGENDAEVQDCTEDGGSDVVGNNIIICQSDAIVINQDFAQIQLQRSSTNGLPIYTVRSESEITQNGNNYNFYRNKFSAFVQYQNAFIRKTTALYLIQENCEVSNDRLIRVRRDQPDHLFSVSPAHSFNTNCVQSGDLCIFRRVDNCKNLIGRVIQFSYLDGSKRDQQYTSIYVDMSKDSFRTIGCFANWYSGVYDITSTSNSANILPFKPLNIITIGYLSMENYVGTVSEETLVEIARILSNLL